MGEGGGNTGGFNLISQFIFFNKRENDKKKKKHTYHFVYLA